MAGQEQTTAVPDAATTADISALPTQTTSTSQNIPDVINVAAQIPQDDGISTQLSGEGGYQAPDENSMHDSRRHALLHNNRESPTAA